MAWPVVTRAAAPVSTILKPGRAIFPEAESQIQESFCCYHSGWEIEDGGEFSGVRLAVLFSHVSSGCDKRLCFCAGVCGRGYALTQFTMNDPIRRDRWFFSLPKAALACDVFADWRYLGLSTTDASCPTLATTSPSTGAGASRLTYGPTFVSTRATVS
jgi:hypothetical protein